ncbi:YagE family protein [Histoplasma capsulatum var. duboisii H88]|uniref:YagE family protein n=1 Tax=Ajellomyces capsulatus (strain H88) TaxID=544711 RepID=F0U5H7_AJEC8|nr:YagE family protein [Histoplasma capsulatum var. duboisii H88]QSS52260.1 YagE family protein [Histoplasma capsulatum var. duboisii H88]
MSSYQGISRSRSGKGKRERGPTVLVTDSRDSAYNPRRGNTQNTHSSRFITVDNVLQYTSDIPSMQQRHPPPGFRGRPRLRLGGPGALAGATASTDLGGSSGMDSRMRAVGRLAAVPHLPPRSTKTSEKLVLLPETVTEQDEGGEDEGFAGAVDEERGPRMRQPVSKGARRIIPNRQQMSRKTLGDFDQDNEASPLLAEEERLKRRRVPPERAKSYAERLPKAHRAQKLPRVTAYCTAQGYKISSTAAFVKEYHGARTKLYDDCLYTAYHLPLLPGKEGYRIRSSPILKSAGGKAVLDEEIERNERRDYHDEYYAEEDEHSVKATGFDDAGAEERTTQREGDDGERLSETNGVTTTNDEEQGQRGLLDSANKDGNTHNIPTTISAARIPPNALSFSEMFIFSYGVVVLWNFTEREEKEVLADLAFASSESGGAPIALATAPLPEEDFETEEFHFEYSDQISRPRVYNDMITLRSGDHMIKLAISHGIAQSTKLSFFEEVMARQMAEAKDVPRRLALTGHLGMKREEVFRILGKLFKSRVEVNLSSNMLDVPSFFWDSEPTLHPLYIAVREYLEIKRRIQVLNERCRVFLDLAEILSDSIADNQMSRQTWIIIVLIGISIIVTISEVILRFGMLSTRSSTTAQPSHMLHTAASLQGRPNIASVNKTHLKILPHM